MNRYALITGATGGLGKAFCVECAKRGYNLMLTDISHDKLEKLANCLKSAYKVNVEVFVCNLMKLSERKALYKKLDETGKELFLTINIAGLDYEGGIETLNSNKISRVLRINTESTLDITRYSATSNHSSDYYIINVASMAGFYPMPLKALYSASKRAIIQFSIAVREEIRHKGGHVTVLCPAGLRTNAKVRASIEAQGLMGDLTTVDTGIVAYKTIEKAFQDKVKYIPGLINVLIVGFSSLIPETIKAKYVYKRWATARSKKDTDSYKDNKVLY